MAGDAPIPPTPSVSFEEEAARLGKQGVKPGPAPDPAVDAKRRQIERGVYERRNFPDGADPKKQAAPDPKPTGDGAPRREQ
jgi:hypothetical protein